MSYAADTHKILLLTKAMLEEDKHPPLDLGTGARPAKENLRQEFRVFEMNHGSLR